MVNGLMTIQKDRESLFILKGISQITKKKNKENIMKDISKMDTEMDMVLNLIRMEIFSSQVNGSKEFFKVNEKI